jgi:cytochrome c
MKKSIVKFTLLIVIGITLLSIDLDNESRFSSLNTTNDLNELSVLDALLELGDAKPNHYLMNANQDSVRMGYEMVNFGQLIDKSNSEISKFFVCTDCHNQVIEVADLSKETPSERIKYGMKNELPFLPASTFYGMYNKSHWYNGDYASKYGDLVKPTRDTLKNAIQLCATQCSQGRPLENWELNAILHYYKSLEFKVKDLNLDQSELNQLLTDLATHNIRSVDLLKSKYSSINKATFGKLDPTEPENYITDLNAGEYIFKEGCLHCHGMGKDITNFEFDNDKLTLSFLDSKLKMHNSYSVPYIVRKGTYAVSGRKQYMPQYPLEKMSNSQLFDLINYIKSESK